RLQHIAGFEHKNLPRQDRHFLARFGVAADPLVLGAHLEGAERGQLDVRALHQGVGDQFKHPLDQFGRLGPGQSHRAVNRIRQIGPRYRLLRHSHPQISPYDRFPRRTAWKIANISTVGATRTSRAPSRGTLPERRRGAVFTPRSAPGLSAPQDTNALKRLRSMSLDYQRISEAPQVKPPPMASIMTRSPCLIRPSATATLSASGTEAAEVLAWRSTVVTTFSGGRPN